MANAYYTHTTYPGTNSQGASASMRAELDAVMAGFTLLPDPLGSGQKGFNGGQFNSPIIVGGLIDNVTIGGLTKGPGSFTSLLATGDITRDGLPTTNRAINFMSNGVKRAAFYVSATETGGNAGSDIYLQTYSDAGALIATAMKITRADSSVAFAGGITAPSLNGATIGGVTRGAGSFTTLDANGTLNVSGAASFGARIGITANTPVLDFTDSGQTLPNGKFRFYTAANIFGLMKNTAVEGDFSAFTTLMYFSAAGQAFFNTRPSFNGATPWDSSNLPNPATTSGGVTSGTQSFAGMVTFNGGATLNTQDGTFSEPLIFQSNAFAPRMRANTANSTLEWVNSAGTTVNMGLNDNGVLTLPRARPSWAGLVPWDSGNLPNPAQTTGATFSGVATFNNTVQVRNGNSLQLWGAGNTYVGFLRGDPSGFVGFINQAGNAFNAIFNDNGVVNFPRARPTWAGVTPWDTGNFDPNSKVAIRNSNGNHGYVFTDTSNNLTFNWESSRTRMWVDGSNQGLLWTDANFDPNSKANAGSVCQWNTTVLEVGPISSTVTPGAPYVSVGARGGTGSATANFIFNDCVQLRNQ